MIRVLLLALALVPRPVTACEVALMLAMDVSGSVDPAEYRLQVDGLALALADPSVRDVLVQGQVALSVMQWSGVGSQAVVLPWQRMLSADQVDRFAAATRAMTRAFAVSDTAVGAALDFALAGFAPVSDCRRRVIDMSGDGNENVGFTIGRARSAAQASGTEVNGLAIEGMGLSITNFYRNQVITKGGFVETARGHLDYARAIRAKMLRELTKPSG
ncbi:MAG: DUF1194 domain-containing protein [Gemmobacter sp.]|nr:DUF1194 domain-containing protein [Gemmobacter sp.]